MYYVIGKDNCPWCQKAKALLDQPGKPPYVYKNLDTLPEIKREFWVDFIKNELSFNTVPVVIKVVGGYEDLYEDLHDD